MWWRGNGSGLRTRIDDRFIVSYPKSGNTWMRVMVASLLDQSHEPDLAKLGHLVPDVYRHSAAELTALPSPRFIKSHEAQRANYGRVVYLVRDPRDVLISYFHFERSHRGDSVAEEDLAGYADRFLSGYVGFGRWDVHVGGWFRRAATDRNVTVIRYEALLADPAAGLRQACTVLGLEPDDAAIARAVAAGSFERLHDQELDARDRGAFAGSDANRSRFFRREQAGSHRDELPPELAQRVCQQLGPVMRQAGYDPDAG